MEVDVYVEEGTDVEIICPFCDGKDKLCGLCHGEFKIGGKLAEELETTCEIDSSELLDGDRYMPYYNEGCL